MTGHIDRAVQVIEGHVSTTLLATDIAQELDAAGLLATPERDAAVSAEALRSVADALNAEDSNEWADEADREAVRIIELIRDRADRIEGESRECEHVWGEPYPTPDSAPAWMPVHDCERCGVTEGA